VADYVRRAGRADLAGGALLLWSVAEGRRGARWRASGRRAGRLLWDLLLEVGVDGRPGRLEIATAAGQLTLHPEPDGTSAHGNVVSAAGVRPLVHPWTDRHWFEFGSSPIPTAALCRALRPVIPPGEARPVPGLHVDDALVARPGVRTVHRLTDATWRIEDADGSTRVLSLDAEGLPVFEAASGWPLEVDITG
jgi:hypothetical protein